MENLRKEFFAAGLGTAMREQGLAEECINYHATMRLKWKFCPHCGTELHVKRVCHLCNRKFLSESSFDAHLKSERPKCPVCNSRNAGSARGVGAKGGGTFARMRRHICKDCGTLYAWSWTQAKSFKLEYANENDKVQWQYLHGKGGE